MVGISLLLATRVENEHLRNEVKINCTMIHKIVKKHNHQLQKLMTIAGRRGGEREERR